MTRIVPASSRNVTRQSPTLSRCWGGSNPRRRWRSPYPESAKRLIARLIRSESRLASFARSAFACLAQSILGAGSESVKAEFSHDLVVRNAPAAVLFKPFLGLSNSKPLFLG